MKRERKQYSEKEKKAAISLLKKGKTQRAVADKMGIHFTTINRWSLEERFWRQQARAEKELRARQKKAGETLITLIKPTPKPVQKTKRIQEVVRATKKKTARIQANEKKRIARQRKAGKEDFTEVLKMANADPVQICSMSAPINDLILIRMTLMGNIELSSEAEELLNKQKPRTKKSG